MRDNRGTTERKQKSKSGGVEKNKDQNGLYFVSWSVVLKSIASIRA